MTSAPHVPVLGPEAVAALRPREGALLVDATYGAGGYTEEMLTAGARVVAFDRDPSAIATGEARHEGVTFVPTAFGAMAEELGARGLLPVDGVAFDLGVSSMQLDRGERGFSFMRDGPLDMRMAQAGEGPSAARFVNEAEEGEIADVLYQYGEEKRSRRLARAIVADRVRAPFETTGQLAALAERVLGNREKTHPATRLFQAVRILVNDEFGQVVRGLIAAERCLRAGGRLAVVTFHSLEDRIVKRFFGLAAGGRPARSRYEPEGEDVPATLTPVGKATAPSHAEIAANPRARSARLRVAERTGEPPRDWSSDLGALGAPPLAFSDLQRRWAA